MSKPTNTSKDEINPSWVGGGDPGAIEAQEKRGQKELIVSESLPIEMDAECRQALESAGVVFGEPYEDDPLFCIAQLPEGWSKRATDHDMWSELIDGTGKVRAGIFYKAAFYDRRAMLCLR